MSPRKSHHLQTLFLKFCGASTSVLSQAAQEGERVALSSGPKRWPGWESHAALALLSGEALLSLGCKAGGALTHGNSLHCSGENVES